MRSAITICLSTSVILSGAGVAASESWYVACDTGSKLVLVTQSVDGTARMTMAGPLPSRRTAEIWLAESCPGALCDEQGRCAEEPPADEGTTGGDWVAGEVRSETVGTTTDGPAAATGWVAGEVTSVSLDGGPGGSAAVAGPAGPTGPAGPAGPGGDDLQPLMDNALVAVEACNFHAALLTADHVVNFDPAHPWLVANHDRLRNLARRQQATEDAVWQASSALSAGDLKKARKLAQAAADTSVSCQSRAVSDLLAGIDAAIAHKKQVNAAKTSAAMAAMLPGLIDLANTAIAVQNGTPAPPSTSGSYGGLGGATSYGAAPAVSVPDPCAFKYEYRNVWNTEPVCTCPGYRFDATQHRCVR